MQTIGITDFWTNKPELGSVNNFTILSDNYVNLGSLIVGDNRILVYNGTVDKYQIKAVVIDNTFYIDFSFEHTGDQVKQQMWILKHTKGIEYDIRYVCLWEMFKLPTIEELNAFARIKAEEPVVQAFPDYNTAIDKMTQSTFLRESDFHPRGLAIETYLSTMTNLIHSVLTNEEVVIYATVIYNRYNSVHGSQEQDSR